MVPGATPPLTEKNYPQVLISSSSIGRYSIQRRSRMSRSSLHFEQMFDHYVAVMGLSPLACDRNSGRRLRPCQLRLRDTIAKRRSAPGLHHVGLRFGTTSISAFDLGTRNRRRTERGDHPACHCVVIKDPDA
jgi:hypothetical protein